MIKIILIMILQKLSTQLKIKVNFPNIILYQLTAIDDTITHKSTFLPFSYLNYLQCGKSIFIPKIGNVLRVCKIQ